MLGILARQLKLCKNIHEEVEFVQSWGICIIRTANGLKFDSENSSIVKQIPLEKFEQYEDLLKPREHRQGIDILLLQKRPCSFDKPVTASVPAARISSKTRELTKIA